MALTKIGGDLLVTNQLKIEMRIINNAQAWAEQVKGVYYFLYPHMVNDFSHTRDIQIWIDTVFAKHKHGRPGCQGGVTTLPPLPPAVRSQIPDIVGKGLLEFNMVLGTVRRGMLNLAFLVFGINRINKPGKLSKIKKAIGNASNG